MYPKYLKPFLDFIFGLLFLIVSLPIVLVTILILAFVNNGIPFFAQLRPGKNQKVFKLIKFKTMRDEWDVNGEPLPDKQRLTRVGYWIRRLSIDEIPQLINVISGDMSLIGPRPLLMEYLPMYSERQRRRHEVKPGITGWAQINGRNLLSWEEKFEFDIWYVDNLSFLLDLKIFLKTVFKIFKMEGINSATSSTMEKFQGSSKEHVSS